MRKRFLSMLLAAVMLYAFTPTIFVKAHGELQYNDYLYYLINDSNTAVTITNCDSSATEIIIPSQIGGLPVTTIGYEAFYDNVDLKSVTIPNSVIDIEQYAFRGCNGLTNINIPDSVISIGSGAFDYCKKLKDITLSNSLKSIGDYAFRSCDNLTNIALPESLANIGRGIFEDCYGLTNITIPNSVTNITDSMFCCCIALKTVTIPINVISIENSAFSGCNSLTDVYFDGSEEQWQAVTIGSYNNYLISATIHCNDYSSSETPTPEPTQTPIPIPTTDPTPEPSPAFEVNTYRAEYLLNNTIGSVMEDTIFDMTATPSYILYQAGIDSGLYSAASLWDNLTETIDAVNSPSKLIDYTIEEKDIYSAIIFNMFESATDYKVMSCINNDITKGTKNLVSTVTSTMKDLYKFDVDWENYDISKMSDADKDKLQKGINAAFKTEHGDAAAISKLTGVISKGIKYATDLQTYCELAETYYNIYCLSDAMKQVMQEMYNKCPESEAALKLALKDCVSVMYSSENAFTDRMTGEFFGVVGKDVLQVMMDKMWDSIKDSFCAAHPAAYALSAAYKVGKYASNTLYNSDDITEKYFKTAAMAKSENVLESVYNSLKSRYVSDKTEKNAEAYNSVIDVMFNALNTDCDYANSFADSVGSAAMGKIDAVLGDTSVAELKESISSIQNSYYNFHESVLTDWLYQLEEDNPDEYENYKHLLTESWERKRKRYDISCPVDVYIYNSDGVLEGSVVSNTLYCSEDKNITIAVNGNKKTVYFYNDEEYNLVYVGNDNGTMDIAVTEYDDTQTKTRNVYFNGITLADGLTYSSTDSGSACEYAIINENENIITADYDTQNSGDTTYTATLTRGYFTDFALSAELHAGENAEITAYVPEGYKFVGWTSDAGEDIFADASSITTTIRMPAYDVNITANIVEKPRLSIIDKTDTSATVEVLACGDIDSGTVILAVYDADGTLKNAFTKNFEQTVTFDNLDLTNCTVKAMLWDGIGGMKPLADAAEQ